MDVSSLNSQNAAADQGRRSANERAAALGEARQRLQAEHLQSAQASETRSIERLLETREAVSRALGANTRLSISRAENAQIFVYRAIDVDTGKVVHEWPQEQFLALIRGVREDVRTDVETLGLILDNTA